MTISVYLCTSIIQYFIDGFWVSADSFQEEKKELSNVVAVFVDDKLYENKEIKSNIQRYTTQYIQKELDNTKAIVMPLNLKDIHAYEIYRMLENIYFEGIKEENSNLIGTILIGDIPLPVINQNGYFFPSIYPYVDFIEQKYIWDEEQQFFIPNNNTAWQAEIWHGMINYQSDIDSYVKFFQKLKTYVQNSDTFIWDYLWYEDFIANKNNYLDTTLDFYENKVLFTEDIGYLRYHPLMLSYFQEVQQAWSDSLTKDFDAASSVDLSSVSDGGSEDWKTAKITDKTIKEWYLKNYSDLFSIKNSVALRDNSFAGGRYVNSYSTEDGANLKARTHSSTSLIDMKDMFNEGTDDLQGLLLYFNEKFENVVDSGVWANQLDIVVPVSYYENINVKVTKKNYVDFEFLYKNYFFGKIASAISSVKDLNIFRGTRRNLSTWDLKKITLSKLAWDSLNPVKHSNDNTNLSLKSLWSSYDLFSTQTEANRGYNMMNMQNEYNFYNEEKWYRAYEKVCTKKKKFLRFKRCKKWEYRPIWNCNPWDNDEKNDSACETLDEFVERKWGWASPLNLNQEKLTPENEWDSISYELNDVNYKRAWFEIFDLVWQKKLNAPETKANDYTSLKEYGSLIAHKVANLKWTKKKQRKEYANAPDLPFPMYGRDSNLIDFFVKANRWDFTSCQWSSQSFNCEAKDNTYISKNTKDNIKFLDKMVDSSGKPYTVDTLYFDPKPQEIKDLTYTYKTIPSVYKNDEIGYEEYNGLDTTKYAEWWVLHSYYEDILKDIDRLENTLSELSQNFKTYANKLSGFNSQISTINKQIKDFKNKTDKINGKCIKKWSTYTDENGNEIEDVYYEFQPGSNFNVDNLNKEYKWSTFSDWRKQFADIIIYFTNNSDQFHSDLISFSSVDFEYLLSTLKFIETKESLSLPLDFSEEWIKNLQKKIDDLKSHYLSTYNYYNSVFSNHQKLLNSIESIPVDFYSWWLSFSNNLTSQEENWWWNCSNADNFKGVWQLYNTYTNIDWQYEYNFLMWWANFFMTRYEPEQEDMVDEDVEDEDEWQELIDGVLVTTQEYKSHYLYLQWQIKILDDTLKSISWNLVTLQKQLDTFSKKIFFSNKANWNSSSIATLHPTSLTTFIISLKNNVKYIHNLLWWKNINASSFHTGGIEQFTWWNSNLLAYWISTYQEWIGILEAFLELREEFNRLPNSDVIGDFRNDLFKTTDIYRDLLDELAESLKQLKEEYKILNEKFKTIFSDIIKEKIEKPVNSIQVEEATGEQKFWEASFEKILSDLKELEIYSKTGACVRMRNERQDVCRKIMLSWNTLSNNVNSQLTWFLSNKLNNSWTTLLNNITWDCRAIQNTWSEGRSIFTGLIDLDKQLTGALTNNVTGSINELKHIYQEWTWAIQTCQNTYLSWLNTCKNNYTGDLATCQSIFTTASGTYHTYRKDQKSDCDEVFSWVCEKRADDVWSGEVHIKAKEDCEKATIEQYSICWIETWADCQAKIQERCNNSLDTFCTGKTIKEYKSCLNSNSQNCKNQLNNAWCYSGMWFITWYQATLESCHANDTDIDHFCENNYHHWISKDEQYWNDWLWECKTWAVERKVPEVFNCTGYRDTGIANYTWLLNSQISVLYWYFNDFMNMNTMFTWVKNWNYEWRQETCATISWEYLYRLNNKNLYCNAWDNYNKEKCNTATGNVAIYQSRLQTCYSWRNNALETFNTLNKAQKDKGTTQWDQQYSLCTWTLFWTGLRHCTATVLPTIDPCITTANEVKSWSISNLFNQFSSSCITEKDTAISSCNNSVLQAQENCQTERGQIIQTCENIGNYSMNVCKTDTLNTKNFCNNEVRKVYTWTLLNSEFLENNNTAQQEINCSYSEIANHCEDYYRWNSIKSWNVQCKKLENTAWMDCTFSGIQCTTYYSKITCDTYHSALIQAYNTIENKLVGWQTWAHKSGWDLNTTIWTWHNIDINQLYSGTNLDLTKHFLEYKLTWTVNTQTTTWSWSILSTSINTWNTIKTWSAKCEYPLNFPMYPMYTPLKDENREKRQLFHPYTDTIYNFSSWTPGIQYFFTGYKTGLDTVKTWDLLCPILYHTTWTGEYNCEPYYLNNRGGTKWYKLYEDNGQQKERYEYYFKNNQSSAYATWSAKIKEAQEIFTSLQKNYFYKDTNKGLEPHLKQYNTTIKAIQERLQFKNNAYTYLYHQTWSYNYPQEYLKNIDFVHENQNGVTFTGVTITKEDIPKLDTRALGKTSYTIIVKDPDEWDEEYTESWFWVLFNNIFKSAPDGPVHITWLSLLTIDKPIDSPRYVTFQWLKGQPIKFIYPNVFKIEVYQIENGKLKLKSIDDIEKSIYNYLSEQVKVFNGFLQKQSSISQWEWYNLLRTIDKKTFASDRKTVLFQVKDFICWLSDNPRNCWENEEAQWRENIRILAELLYYQNLPVQQRKYDNTVYKDLKYIRESFDFNPKISYILDNYLTYDNQKSKLVLPQYQDKGYEVAYFNSDGEDYIDPHEAPSDGWTDNDFSFGSTNEGSTTLVEWQKEENSDYNSAEGQTFEDECWIPMEEGLLLFSLKDMSSPWLNGFKCWMKQLQDSVKISINFNNSQGPILKDPESMGDVIDNIADGFKSELTDSLNSWKDDIDTFGQDLKQYGDDLGSIFSSDKNESSDVTTIKMDIERANQEAIKKTPNLSNYQNSLSLFLKDKILTASKSEFTTLQISSTNENLGIVSFNISATGDTCKANGGPILRDTNKDTQLCKTAYNDTFKPIQWKEYTLFGGEKAGKSLIEVKMCQGNTSKCITQTVLLETKAWPLSALSLWDLPTEVYAWFWFQFSPKAYDQFDNELQATKETYILSVNTGSLSYNGIKSSHLELDNFKDLTISYLAPQGITSTTSLTFTLTWQQLSKSATLTTDTPITIRGNKTITIKPISVVIKKWDTDIYNNGTTANTKSALTFRLGDSPTEHATGTFTLTFQENNGKNINPKSLFNVENNPITFSTNTKGLMFVDNGTKQKVNVQFKGNIWYVTYRIEERAGKDTLSIKIPLYWDISLPIEVQSWNPYYTQLTTKKSLIKIWDSLTATIHITDAFGNTKNDKLQVTFTGDSNLSFHKIVNLANGDTITITGVAWGVGKLSSAIPGNPESKPITVKVSNSFLPTSWLNVLYGNYFGSDWGNQWGYFSDHKHYIEDVMNQSPKMLAATTQLIKEDNIRQTVRKIDSDFTLLNLNDYPLEWVFSDYWNKYFELSIGNIAKFRMPLPEVQHTYNNLNAIEKFLTTKPWNYLFFLANEWYRWDDFKIKDESGNIVANLLNGSTTITFTNNKLDHYQVWEVWDNGEYGRILFHVQDATQNSQLQIYEAGYFQDYTFEKWSTDKLTSLAIFSENSSFNINSTYLSIQDSDVQENAIGFLADFKNISLFSEGHRVGESTVPYGSELLINLGDPVLKRKEKSDIKPNHEIDWIKFDGWIGKQIFNTPWKNIFKVLPIDFNKDGIKDILVIYTDGTVKLSKNYGVEPYFRNLDNLLFLVSDIDDAFVGDVDGNGYEDIIIKTYDSQQKSQLKVYTNEGGRFDVDGYPACLNINVSLGEISKTPMDLSQAHQIFLEDMDNDGAMDIVTNDTKGYVKIFYGWSTNGHANYLSTKKEWCDSNWYQRISSLNRKSKANMQIVDFRGVKIDKNTKVLDASMLHREGLEKPLEADASQNNSQFYSPSIDFDDPQYNLEWKDLDPEEIQQLVSNLQGTPNQLLNSFNNDEMLSAGTDEALKYQELSFVLPGEWKIKLNPWKVTSPTCTVDGLRVGSGWAWYLCDDLWSRIKVTCLSGEFYDDNGYTGTSLSLSCNTTIFMPLPYLEDTKWSAWKTYKDINGWNLEDGDTVEVTVYIKANDQMVGTFGDIISGPWKYDESSTIAWAPKTMSTQKITYKWSAKSWWHIWTLVSMEPFSYMIQQFSLPKGAELSYTYTMKYVASSVRDIDIKDLDGEDFGRTDLKSDTLKEIVSKPQDGCIKTESVQVNKGNRGFEKTILDLQRLIDKTSEKSQNAQSENEELLAQLSSQTDSSALESALSTSAGSHKESIWDTFAEAFSSDLANNIKNTIKNDITNTLKNWTTTKITFENFNSFIDSKILGPLDDAAKNTCAGFTFGSKQSCKGLPVPFNQAFLAPWEYHLFGCIKLPPLTHTIGRGLPAFFWPGNLWPITWPWPPYLPIPYMPTWLYDDFLWVKGAWPFSSLIRMYAAPTLTAQLWVALCIWPQKGMNKIPEPMASLGGNCIVTVIKPKCWKGNGDGKTDEVTSDGTETYDPYIQELQGNACEWKTQGGLLQNNSNYQSSPFTYSFQPVTKGTNTTNETFTVNKLDGAYFFGAIDFDTTSEHNNAWEIALEHNKEFSFANIEPGGASTNHIKSSLQQGIRKILIDNWLDPQIRYIINNLSKMTLTIKWPKFDQYATEFGKITDGFGKFIDHYKEKRQQKKEEKAEKAPSEEGNNLLKNLWNTIVKSNSAQQQQLYADQLSNPFELLSQYLWDNDLLNIGTKKVTIKIPTIATEDINGYNIYLLQWLEKNGKIVEDWKTQLSTFIPVCFGTWVKFDKDFDFNTEKTKLEKQQEKEEKKKLKEEEKQKRKENWETIRTDTADYIDNANFSQCTSADFDNIKVILDFIKSFDQLSMKVYGNIDVLQQYRDLPFQIYEWVHVLDRYMGEITSVLTNFLGYFSYWMNANANRYQQYVDAIVLIVNTLRSYQTLISFSSSWSSKCSTCSNDSYDQYACKLSLLCNGIKLPILQIPNFKLPNITLDFSDVNLWMSILLPSFRFQTMHVDLPQLPDFPEVPNIDINLNDLAKALNAPGLDGKINLPKKTLNNISKGLSFMAEFAKVAVTIPTLPSPPSLPELPSFIPNIDIKLPMLPPAPKIPALPNQFEAILDKIERIGKIFCTVKKGFGLVAESTVKAKIEQLSQRTYEVPYFDNILDLTNNLKLTAKKNSPVGFDFEISSHVNLQFDSSIIYSFLDTITKELNSFSYNIETEANDLSKKAGNTMLEKTQEWENNAQNWIEEETSNAKKQTQNKTNNLVSYNLNNHQNQTSSLSLDEEIMALQNTTSDELEYLDYDDAKKRLLSALSVFDKKTTNDTIFNKEIKKITKDVQHPLTIEANVKGIQTIEKEVKSLINTEKDKILLAENLLSGNSLDALLAYVQSWGFQENKEQHLAFATPFFTTTKDTIDTLNNLENPLEMILDNKMTIVDGYLNALNTYSAEDLQLAPNDYHNKKTSLEMMKEGMQGVYTTIKQKKPTLLAYKDVWEVTTHNETRTLLSATAGGNSTTTSKVSVDPAAYVDWIFVKNKNKSLTKAVYSEAQTKKIWQQYLTFDINNDKVNDLILWDKHNIYVKYANQKETNKSWKIFSQFYEENPLTHFENKDTYLKKSNLRIASPLEEVKNFKIKSQTFDTISFSWSKSQSDKVVGYLLNFENRVDTSMEKSTNAKLTAWRWNTTYDEYLLVLPQGYQYEDKKIQLRDGKISPIIEKLKQVKEDKANKEKEILEIRTFNTNSDTIQAGIENIDREWKYTRITTLIKDETDGYLKIASPRSNQMVAGRQILWDDKGPSAIINLIRSSKNEVVWTGEELDANVGTHYDLKITWEDNVALKHLSLADENGQILSSLDTDEKQATLLTTGFFFTELNTISFQAKASDHFDNETELTINIEVNAPEIEITNIEQWELGWIITAELSEDIDEGEVTFERERDGIRSILIGKKNKKEYTSYPIATSITTVSGAYYDLSNLIGLYNGDGTLVATVNPENGEIKILDEYQAILWMRVLVENNKLTVPIIQIYKRDDLQILFTLSFPVEKVITALSPTQNYQQTTITENNDMEEFINGQDFYINQLRYLLISPRGALFSSQVLEWSYQFSDGYITYLLGETPGQEDLKYTVKVQPLER